MSFINATWEQVTLCIRRPRRLLNLFSRQKCAGLWRYFQSAGIVKNRWEENDGVLSRSYRSYAEYLSHQKSGLEYVDFSEYDRLFAKTLRERLSASSYVVPGASVLCIAARVGSEVRAFLDLGCFAVGIDINNRRDSPYVLHGDFHQLVFPDHSVDILYTNSLDHSFDLGRVLTEVQRVLKSSGILIVELAIGSEHGMSAGFYEACWWKDPSSVLKLIEERGFEKLGSVPFDIPWPGECFSLRAP